MIAAWQRSACCMLQVVGSGPDVESDRIYDAILSATFAAQRRLWVATPYFVPDEALLRALILSIRRGVDLRVVVPRRSNHWTADLAGGSSLRELAREGGAIHCYMPEMLHAKLIWSRMTWRSLAAPTWTCAACCSTTRSRSSSELRRRWRSRNAGSFRCWSTVPRSSRPGGPARCSSPSRGWRRSSDAAIRSSGDGRSRGPGHPRRVSRADHEGASALHRYGGFRRCDGRSTTVLPRAAPRRLCEALLWLGDHARRQVGAAEGEASTVTLIAKDPKDADRILNRARLLVK
jgi:hypothetical protein